MSLVFLANTDNPRKNDFIGSVKTMLVTWTKKFAPYQAPLVANVMQSTVPAAGPMGHKHFWRSDYTVHRNTNWFASVRMLSDRVSPGEFGKKTWHVSDGRTYVVVEGNEYLRDDILATLDWSRLPGTTGYCPTSYAPGLLTEGVKSRGTRSFVGGVSLGKLGVSAMDFEGIQSGLTAKKSWFFFDDEIVCMGADINGDTRTAETIVNQWPLPELTTPLHVDGTPMPAFDGWESTLSDISWPIVIPWDISFPQVRQSTPSGWSNRGVGSNYPKEKVRKSIRIPL